MTDRNKFEEMLERLVNEDREGAEALFHEIVVEKSRDIYESLLEDEEVEETTDEEVDEATDEEVDESEEDLDEATDEEVDEAADEDLDEADEEVDENFFDVAEGDPEDDMMGDIEMPMGGDDMEEPEMGDDDMGMGDEDGDVEDRVADLEDELEALKAEFEAMMGDEGEGDEGEDDMDMDMPMDMDSEEGDDDEEEMEQVAFEDEEVEEAADEEEVKEGAKSAGELMREYVDTVSATMGDNGANAKSVVAGPNNMGGTSANIAKGGTEAGVEANKGNLKGSALSDQNPKDMNTKNVNVPGAKGATNMNSTKGHGAEKKGAGETADKGAGSPLNGAPKRAK